MKTKNFYLFIFGMIFLIGVVSSSYTNQTDGFSTSSSGADVPVGITTNGSDFWVIDNTDRFIYHFNRAGNNCTGINCEAGFSTLAAGAITSRGHTTNGSDFWVTDLFDEFVYHFNRTGGNMTAAGPISDVNAIGTPGFRAPPLGEDARSLGGITTNGSDFWVLDTLYGLVEHYNRTGTKIGEFGLGTASNSWGITTNGSDFWVVDSTDDFVYHFNRTGGNITVAGPISSTNAIGEPGFSISAAGATATLGIATNVTSGKPFDFWISDNADDFVYHFASSCICPVGTNANWEIDMSEACVITANCNLGTGRLNFTNSGSATLSAIINTTDMGIPQSGATVFITSAGRLNVY